MRKLYALVAVGLTGVGLIMACGSDGASSDFVDPTIDGGNTSSSGDPPILGGDSAPDPNAQAFTITPPDPVVTFTRGNPRPRFSSRPSRQRASSCPRRSRSIAARSAAVGSQHRSLHGLRRRRRQGEDHRDAQRQDREHVGHGQAQGHRQRQHREAMQERTAAPAVTAASAARAPAGRSAPRSSRSLTGAPVADPGPLVPLSVRQDRVAARHPRAARAVAARRADRLRRRPHQAQRERRSSTTGFFAKTATPFVHHPIPQQAWKQLLASNAGEDVTVTLVFAKGGVAYGPHHARSGRSRRRR